MGWIFSLEPRIAAVDQLEPTQHDWAVHDHTFRLYRPREGVRPQSVEFGNLGYADDARASYELFERAIERGVLPSDVRFQVAVPTAYMALLAYIDIEFREALAPAYERALAAEIARMLERIPPKRLAIQWDVPCEVGITEQVGPPHRWTFEDAVRELARMVALVPTGVEVGIHCCYGDPPDTETGHGKHWLEPADAGAMVRLTNALLERVERPVDWVHMPVPIGRHDEPFFAPVANLRLPPATELYLGLVHFEDGVSGTQRRIEAAAQIVRGFGVAAECGLGRIPRDEVAPTLEIHREVVVPA